MGLTPLRQSLYLCTPDRPDVEYFVDECISGGVDLVQLREKHLDAKDLIIRARLVKRVCEDHGVPFILNDRPDLALEVDADGVHVGQDDAPVTLARKILGKNKIIGLSTHAVGEFELALNEDCDYLSAGPIVPTPTKPGRHGTGLEYIAQAKALLDRVEHLQKPPVFVTGGITPEVIPDVVKAGGSRFVVVRYLTDSDRPRDAARRLADAISRATDASR